MNEPSSAATLITPPKGFVPPEGTAPGKPFDLVCTFVTKEDGRLEMTKLGNSDMSTQPPAPETKPDYSEYANGIMSEVGQESEA